MGSYSLAEIPGRPYRQCPTMSPAVLLMLNAISRPSARVRVSVSGPERTKASPMPVMSMWPSTVAAAALCGTSSFTQNDSLYRVARSVWLPACTEPIPVAESTRRLAMNSSRSLLRRHHPGDAADARVAGVQIVVLIHRPVAGLDELTVADAHAVANRTDHFAAAIELQELSVLPTCHPRLAV